MWPRARGGARLTGWGLLAVGVGMLGSIMAGEAASPSQRAQAELAENWSGQTDVAAVRGDDRRVVADPGIDDPGIDGAVTDDPVVGDRSRDEPTREQHDAAATAVLWFERDGERIVTDDELYVLAGTSNQLLARGPGHYPGSAPAGGKGNFAVAGHRTTHGAPFRHLDRLRAGDTIHVVDRAGRGWVYLYHSTLIVEPHEVWVVGDDPLADARATITLTTCHPVHSARQRLVVFGELVDEPQRSAARSAVS